MDFYLDNDLKKLKKEYIEESIKIGFNFKTFKLLRFKNIFITIDIKKHIKIYLLKILNHKILKQN